MTEWPKVLDCKSNEISLREFESHRAHLNLLFNFNEEISIIIIDYKEYLAF